MENYEGAPGFNGSEIAVIGMACRFPGARNIDEYWRFLQSGLEGISFLTDEELDRSGMDAAVQGHPNYVKAAAPLDDVELFDASFFGYTPKEAEIMDPQQRVFLELSWEALENAGYDPTSYKGAIGIYAGARTDTYLYNLFSNPDALGSLGAFEIGLGNDLAFLSARVAYKLGLTGPAYSVHTACSTGLVVIHLACQSLLIDECQIALAGGIAVNVPQKTGYLYQDGGVVSPDGYCRPFDAKAGGTIFGSGAGIVVLKRLEDALADGDQIYAVIKGSACNNDGSSKASFTAPGIEGQARVVSEAIAVAGVEPETISYVETHGTGTLLGDPIEIRALTKAFRASTDKKNFCAIGSVKSNFGHLDAAAGIASFIKTVLALHNGILPPSLHFEQPNPNIDFVNSPFYVNTAMTGWKSTSAPRRAGVSSFGIGGTNAHMILEEAPPVDTAAASRPYQLILLSAKTSSALESVTSNLGDYLAQHPEINIADVAYTLHVGRTAFSHRAALVCRDVNDAINALHAPEPSRVLSAVSEEAEPGIVFMFPGQGAQHINMGKDLYHAEPAFREHIDQCAEILKTDLGFDLRDVLYPDEARAEEASRLISETYVTQPALFAVEYSLAKLWMQWGVRPRAMIGHSIGEYVAACLAGVLSLEDALRLVAARGRMMQQVPEGDMLAVPLPESNLSAFLNNNLSLAAVNAASQSVVSGTSDAISELQQRLNAQGVETRRLNTSHAFHSHMMAPLVKPFAEQVGQTARNSPQIPYVSSLTGTWITQKEIADPLYWAEQLRHTVRFAEGVKELLKEGFAVLLEVGPGQTLTRLAKQSFNGAASQMAIASLPRQDDLQSDLAFLLTSLGRLWLSGVPIDAQKFYANRGCRRVALSTYPFERQRYWIDSKSSSVGLKRAQASMGKISDITSWFYAPSWKRSTMPRSHELSEVPQRWLIFADECGIGSAILQQLTKAGHDVVIVKPAEKFEKTDDNTYSINPRASEDYEAVLNSFEERGGEVNRIIHLWSVMTDAAHSDASFFQKAQDLGYYSLLFLTWALAKTNISTTTHIEVVSNQMQDVNGEDFYPEKSTLLGPCIVVPQEHSNILCRSVDIVVPQGGSQQAAELTDHLIAELENPSSETIIAYRGKHRWVRHYEPLPMRENTNPVRSLRQNGVYLITGGLGGVGLILAEYLAETVKARLVLTRLSPFPHKDRWAEWLETHGSDDDTSRRIGRLQALEEMGAEVIVASADVSDQEQMRSLVERIYEQFGELNGVLHAAGVTSGSSVYRAVTEVGPAESEAQFRPKVHGVYVLEKVLRGKAVDFCLLFSSNASVLGGLGFVAYAAANLFMDNFACSRDREGPVRWLCANWDHWPEETRQFAAVLPSVDQFSMTRKESEEAFRRVVCMAAGGQVVVSTGDLKARLGLWVNRELAHAAQTSAAGDAAASHPRPHLQTAYVAPQNDIEQKVADIWQQVLGIQQVGIHDNFFDLGGHSLLVSQVIGRLREAFQVDLPLSKIFDVPTVSGLAEVIAHIKNEVEDQERLEVLDILSRLSEEGVEAELAKRADSHDEL